MELDFEALYREERTKRLKAEELQSKAEELQSKVEEEARYYKFKYEIPSFIAQSRPSLYRKFIEDGIPIKLSDFKLPYLSNDLLQKTWRSISKSQQIISLCEGLDEKGQVHPFIDEVLRTVLKQFSNLKMKHHKEAVLRSPDFVPDFVLTPKETAHPGWLECYGFIECKAYKKGSEMLSNGGGQAISYLATSMNLKDSNSKIFKFSAVTDGRRIQFFFCNNFNFIGKNKIFSPVLDLIHDSEVVPEGLIMLCKLINLTANSNFPDFEIKVGRSIGTINQVYERSADIIVADAFFPGDPKACLVKQSINNNKSGTFSIRKEVMMYKILENTPVKTLKLSSRCLSDCLVLDEIGITLKSWSHDILFRDENSDEIIKEKKFIECIVKLFDQIRLLHDQGFTHGDIRPANVIVLEDSNEPHLIDFVTATKIGQSLQFIHGTVMYAADDVLRAETPFVLKPVHDLEAFAYSFLDCIEKRFFQTFLLLIADKFTAENDSIEVEYCEYRKSALEELQTEMETNPDFESENFPYMNLVSIFFSFLNRLRALPNTENDLISTEDYEALRGTLTL